MSGGWTNAAAFAPTFAWTAPTAARSSRPPKSSKPTAAPASWSPTTNTFNIATSWANAMAGTFVNTSGSQSGTHTGENRTTVRGTAADLVIVNGIKLNSASITNGPAASRGTWLGTIKTNASSQLDFIFGASASGGTAAYFGVYNAYNRVSMGIQVID